MKKNRSILKTLLITTGLNILLAGDLFLFSRLVHTMHGQALLFLSVTLLMTVGVCLFAVIPASEQGNLWGCFGVAIGLHFPLLTAVTMTGGNVLSQAWPGGTGNNLAAPLIFLISIAVWFIGCFWVTVLRTAHIGSARREKKRQVQRATKGFSKEYPPISSSRARLLAILRGFLWVLWLHVLTALLFEWLQAEYLHDTMLSYTAFPVLWSLMAASFGLLDRKSRTPLLLSAAVSNLLLFLLPTALLTVANTPVHKLRFILPLDSVLTTPLNHPEQMLVIGVFMTVWAAMIVFGIGHKRQKI